MSLYLAGPNQSCRYQGKTTYLYLRIIEFLIEGRPFLYQTKDRIVYYVTGKGVEAIPSSWRPETYIVAFVDADEGDSRPHDILRSRPFGQIIVASSPEGVHHKWLKQAGLNICINKIATSLWLPCELFLTGLVLIFLLPTLD